MIIFTKAFYELRDAGNKGEYYTPTRNWAKKCLTVDEEYILQLKPVAYVLGLTNLILHEMDVPDYVYKDSLKTEYNSIGRKDQVDVIADLFVILMLQLLKPKGRAVIVLPDGSITGDGVKKFIVF
ncbi:type I restriction-modification system subunit M [Lebetimonas sp. JH292]|uniref:type I restriction-modification system subunit M n=1 Tax=Lebetimonas sp. JH292 TaxID=990068 RepID=UPI00046727EB|nr:type I restriction-modification system subunit M [Lebetimonas sp. JH292]